MNNNKKLATVDQLLAHFREMAKATECDQYLIDHMIAEVYNGIEISDPLELPRLIGLATLAQWAMEAKVEVGP